MAKTTKMPKEDVVLALKHVSVVVEDNEVVHDLSLELKQGECHVLMGPNGSGKSSLANVLAGHPSYSVASGHVKLFGQDLLARSPDERAQLGLLMAFQHPVEVPGLSVWQFLWQAYQQRFAADQPRQGTKIAKAIDFIHHLESLAPQVGLEAEMVKRGLNEGFSGGEKKRLEMLQLLVLEPKIAIFDETDSGLDVDAIKLVAKNIAFLQKKYQTTMLIITHYQRLLKYMQPDFVHILVKGTLVESGDERLIQAIEKSGYAGYSKSL